jgi:hypothetical protein
MKNITLLLSCFFLSINLCAQDLNIKDFKEVLKKIRLIDRYTYVNKTTAMFPNGQKDEMNTTTFIDKANNKLAYRNEVEHVILNNQWFYKVNFSEEFVSIFDVNSYKKKYGSDLGNLTAVFKSVDAVDLLDTLVSKHGRLFNANRKGNVSEFEFQFDKEFYLKSFVLKFDNASGLPISVFFKLVSEDPFGRKIEMNVRCDGYKKDFPVSEFETSKFFSKVGSKVTLHRYPKYKLTTIF